MKLTHADSNLKKGFRKRSSRRRIGAALSEGTPGRRFASSATRRQFGGLRESRASKTKCEWVSVLAGRDSAVGMREAWAKLTESVISERRWAS